ncbi:aspartate kinase [Flavobacterium yafengii]|uniref:aspartate kinase n=1 Tax=Flavobacterium yafengii TaxID=3041253 RepID=UPI0024A98B0F|nr:aspartate kinase [Flavobacterium yafengii]MDI5897166.1 aspartate kinase [Flavobacterium yafengii]
MSALRINIVLFGIGNVGGSLIQQVLESQHFFQEKYNIELRFPIITNSSLAFFEKEGLANTWEANFAQSAIPFRVEDIIEYTTNQGLENLIAVDATNSPEIVKSYISLIQNGFNIVAANKTANILHHDFYTEIRRNLKKFDKDYLYEANISAGLPILNTIKELHFSGEKITKIRGVFSSSLSYIFNRFGNEDIPFSKIIEDAEKLGYTKIDSREDLSGNAVAEKLVILAREIEHKAELKEVQIMPLLIPTLNETHTKSAYKNNKNLLDKPYRIAKLTQNENHVLRYVGEFDIESEKIEVKLISVPFNSVLGQLQDTENLIEIYTKTNSKNPIIIQGTGSGKEIAARAILKDILKISNHIKQKETIWL